MNDREAILRSIRQSLQANRARILDLAGDAPSVRPRIPESGAALVDRFCTELTALNGVAHRCASLDAAAASIVQIMDASHTRQAIAWEDTALPDPALGDALRTRGVELLPVKITGSQDRQARIQTLGTTQVCLSGADAGIAQSGTIAVVSGPGRPRVASLLAPTHVAVLRAADILPTLEDALDHLRKRFGPELAAAHSNLALITGPSRSADIELTLARGVHGPKEVHVIIME